MYYIFAQAYTACVRAYQNTESKSHYTLLDPPYGLNRICLLGSHEQHAQNLTYPCQSAGIDLTYIDRFSLKQLLENHSIMRMFASGYSDTMGFEGFTNSRVA
jgi:hypothetical protein